MDSKKPSWGTGHYLMGFLTFLTLTLSPAQTMEQMFHITQATDQVKLTELISNFEKEILLRKDQLKNRHLNKLWGVGQKQLDGTVVSLNDIGVDGTPLFYTTFMGPTSKVSRANALYADGLLDLDLSGADMKVGVWDAGVARTTHQEFNARVTNADGSEVDNHGTLVTGVVVSSGIKERAKGVAFGAEALGHDWSRDKIEVAEAAANGLLLSNHSYGIRTDRVPDWYFGAYIKTAQDWDKIMNRAPYYLMVIAAGNAQNSNDNETPNFGRTQDGFDLLVGFTTAKNGLVIAGANAEIDEKGILKNAKVTRYSSFGPTDDGRIKPDLAGDGTLVYSTSADSNTSYGSTMGTSMATPGVTGSLLLLQEYHEELYGHFMKSATLKGLALHTADDVQEPGPDYKMGWGVMNTKKAAEILKNKDFSTLVSEEKLNGSQTYSITLKANGGEPLTASISWTDPAGETINRGDLNSSVKALTNDLDIRITKGGETYFPWKLDPAMASNPAQKGDNSVDPYEQIHIPNANGTYTITISHKDGLLHGSQDFSLIVSGARLTTCQLQPPNGTTIETSGDSGTAFAWSPLDMETLYEVQIKAATEGTWEAYTTRGRSLPLDNLVLGKKYTARVRSICSQNLSSEFSDGITFIYNGEATVVGTSTLFPDDGAPSLKIYPNPVVHELRIETELSMDAHYSVISAMGKIVKSGRIEETINVADLATGLYVLTVQDYNGALIRNKFFKD